MINLFYILHYIIIYIIYFKKYDNNKIINGDWGLGIGDWGLGPIPNPQSPIPNPHPQLKKNNILY